MFIQTADERRASVTGTNIFFGALLGVNLGTVNSLDLRDYSSLAFLLGGAVAGLFTIAVTRRRKVMVSMIILYAVLLGSLLLVPSFRPDGMDREIVRVVATLFIWLLFIVVVRITPMSKEEPPPNPATDLIEED